MLYNAIYLLYVHIHKIFFVLLLYLINNTNYIIPKNNNEYNAITQSSDIFPKFGIYLNSVVKEQEKKKKHKKFIENITTLIKEDESSSGQDEHR